MKNINKKALTTYESEAIESLVQKIISSYEENFLGLSREEQTNINDTIQWNDTYLDILDGDYNVYTIFDFAMKEFFITKDYRFIISGYIINEEDEWDDSNTAFIDATKIVGQRNIDVSELFESDRIEKIA